MEVSTSDGGRSSGRSRTRNVLGAILLVSSICSSWGQSEEVDPGWTDTSGTPEAELTTNETINSEKNDVKMLEDGTVADALQRRPDLRFGNVTVDGEKTSVSLSSMSSAAVENVEVLKAVTPDVDADSLGGSVSVRSKPAFEQSRRTFQGRLALDYDFGLGQADTKGTLTLGNAFGADRQWGALFTARGDLDYDGSDNMRIDWMGLDAPGDDLRVMENLMLEQWQEKSNEMELTGMIDHRVNENLSLFLRGNFLKRNSNIDSPALFLRFGDGVFLEADEEGALVEDAGTKRNLVAFEGFTEEWGLAVGGYFVTESLDGDFRLSYDGSDYLEPDFFIIRFEQPDIDLAYGLEDRDFPTFRQVDGNSLYDPSAYPFDEMLSEVWAHNETDLVGTLNLKVDHGLGLPDTGYWKAGGKYRMRTVDQSSDGIIQDEYLGDYRQSDVVGDYRNDDFFGGRYHLAPATGRDRALAFRDANLDRFVINERRTRENSDPATYDAGEQILAGYGMASVDTGRFRILAGLRYEQTSTDYTGREVVIDENGAYESTFIRTGTSVYGNAFPGIHALYRISDRLALIGSWTDTIDRPDFRDLVPYRFVNRERETVEEGNPELQPTLLTNYDLALDYATPGDGLLSLELFAREVSDFLYSQESIIAEGPYEGYTRYRLENGPSASILGAEITWAQGLGVVHQWLDSWAFNINLLLRDTSIRYPSRPDEDLPLADLPDEELTLAVSYENARFFGQIEVTRTSDSLRSVGEIKAEDRYNVGQTWVSLNTTYEFIAGVKLIAELHNLTNSSDEQTYESNPRYPTYYRSATRRATLGVRWDL